ncbi:tetratricopeptide repeat protein 38 family protein [Legionella antarctica]|uniref:Tetratricopeptide repeat protein 38 n=2 Tax=Legionella antarctica TaxID=2708020 RepID=A0A6F8T1B3_9GAMM|nr:tetratricopeptide repeat protein 38 family protein [Legionella antarctica]
MMTTKRGLAVTTDSHDVIDSIDHFHQQILGSGQSAGNILDAAERNPSSLLTQTYAAAYYLYAQEYEVDKQAKIHLVQAEKLLQFANLREQILYEAVFSWYQRDYTKAINLLENVVALFPKDTLALKFLEWLFYCTGQAFQADNFLRVCNQCASENQDESHFLAIHSFALELCGHYAQSMEMAEAAIAMNRVTPWAHHTLSHVYLLNHDFSGGVRRLGELQSSWDQILPLLKGHNTWHLALFHLAQRNENEVMKLYPAVFGTMPDTVLEQIDALSLIWRMDMAGLSQEKMIHSVASHLGSHPFEYYTGFNNVHFIYGLVRSGQKKLAKDSLKQMEIQVDSLSSAPLWTEVVLPLCRGVYAFADADYKTAGELMAPVIGQASRIGGSDAQIELLAQTYLLCLLHTQQRDKAQLFFSRQLSHYKNTALADWWKIKI